MTRAPPITWPASLRSSPSRTSTVAMIKSTPPTVQVWRLITSVLAFLRTPTSDIHLRQILQVPQASKSLLSIHRLACDNNAFLECRPNQFFIKEQGTRNTFLRGRCEGGFYLLKSSPSMSSPNKQVLGVIKPSTTLWHHRLGHASTPIVQQVLNRHTLPFVKISNKNMICDACQMGKSHPLPYSRSTSLSTTSPLDLVFFRCMGPCSLFYWTKLILC